MPDLPGRISIHSVNVDLLVRVDIAFSVDASLHSSIFGFYDALNILGH